MMNEFPGFTLNPVQFFALGCDCHYLAKKERIPPMSTHLLPPTHVLTQDYPFAKVAMGWHEEGIGFQITVNQPFIKCSSTRLDVGDNVQLFLDTRDLKTSGFNTRFCHHFFFLPESVEGINRGELTHFRTEDSHPLCDAQLLQCQSQMSRDSYKLKIFIPTQCLYGYDPKQFDRLGFTYRINRTSGKPQHFSVVSQDYQIDQQPSLWGSIKLIE